MLRLLTLFFRFDRRLLGDLLGCAWRAWRLCLAASFDESFEPGGVGFVQTAGELLGWNQHSYYLALPTPLFSVNREAWFSEWPPSSTSLPVLLSRSRMLLTGSASRSARRISQGA